MDTHPIPVKTSVSLSISYQLNHKKLYTVSGALLVAFHRRRIT